MRNVLFFCLISISYIFASDDQSSIITSPDCLFPVSTSFVDTCLQSFVTKPNLINYLIATIKTQPAVHEVPPSPQFPLFTTYNDLPNHKNNILNNNSLIGCMFCNAPFSNRENLKKHIARTHLDHGLYHMSCNRCDTKFLQISLKNFLSHSCTTEPQKKYTITGRVKNNAHVY